jgi:hypothetical protein
MVVVDQENMAAPQPPQSQTLPLAEQGRQSDYGLWRAELFEVEKILVLT